MEIWSGMDLEGLASIMSSWIDVSIKDRHAVKMREALLATSWRSTDDVPNNEWSLMVKAAVANPENPVEVHDREGKIFLGKIPAIKLLRQFTGIGLKDAEDLVEALTQHAGKWLQIGTATEPSENIAYGVLLADVVGVITRITAEETLNAAIRSLSIMKGVALT